MQFLKILFWVLVAFVAALFTYGNWGPVQIRLWNGQVAEVNLPLLLLVTFLCGLLPAMLYHAVARWRLQSRLTEAERTLDQLRRTLPPPISSASATAPPAVEPAPTTAPAAGPVAS